MVHSCEEVVANIAVADVLGVVLEALHALTAFPSTLLVVVVLLTIYCNVISHDQEKSCLGSASGANMTSKNWLAVLSTLAQMQANDVE